MKSTVILALLPLLSFSVFANGNCEPESGPFFCKHYYNLVNISNGKNINTSPKTCEDALSSMNKGLFCRGYFDLVNGNTGNIVNTAPKNCEKTLASMKKTFFCRSYFDLVNGRNGKITNTAPKTCEEVLEGIN